jgi:hypothetical protein
MKIVLSIHLSINPISLLPLATPRPIATYRIPFPLDAHEAGLKYRLDRQSSTSQIQTAI